MLVLLYIIYNELARGRVIFMGKVIAVASGKGGTGKTTTVAAVSSCLAALEYKTLCADFDSEMKNLDLSLCMADYAVADYMDVVTKQLDLMEACHESPLIPGLFFLAAPTIFSPDEHDVSAIKAMFDDIRNEFDYCLIDSPSGIGPVFKLVHLVADMSIIVTTGELPAMRDAQRAASVARELGVRDVRLMVNRLMPKNLRFIRTTIDDVIDTVCAQLIGVIPEDKSVFMSLHANTPLVLYKKRLSAYEFLDVARRITGEEVPLHMR